jgi:hypothetical protein
MKKILIVMALSLIAGPAFAVCGAIPLPVLDGGGVSRNISSATAADGNCKTYIDADTASQIHSDLTAAIPTGTNTIGSVKTTDGTNTAVIDPCQGQVKVYTNVNVVTATNVVITAVSAKKKYICGIFLYPGGADNIAVYQATTATACATAQTAIFGGTTTATGFIATAQAGFVVGNGASAFTATTTVNTDICITTSAAVQLSGVVVTVDQ